MCCHRRASEDCAYDTVFVGCDGFDSATGEEENGAERVLAVALRRLPNVSSSRGGVLIGERRANEARWGIGVSSSNVRLRVERPFAGLLMAIGSGE